MDPDSVHGNLLLRFRPEVVSHLGAVPRTRACGDPTHHELCMLTWQFSQTEGKRSPSLKSEDWSQGPRQRILGQHLYPGSVLQADPGLRSLVWVGASWGVREGDPHLCSLQTRSYASVWTLLMPCSPGWLVEP